MREVIGGVLAALAFIAFIWGLIAWSDAGDNRYYREIERANTICGSAPLRVYPHNDYLSVRCQDGSLKLVVLR